MDHLTSILVTGVAATLVTDLWGIARKPLLGQPVPDYRLLGRWVGHMRFGRFRHERIAAAAPVPAELILGWATHYLTGIAFAVLLFVVSGPEWVSHPTLMPALLVGVGTVAAPFLLMQPAMGAGIAALLSSIMVAIVSAFVLVTTQGLHPDLPAQWLRSCLATWPVAFPTVTLVAPWVRALVGRMT